MLTERPPAEDMSTAYSPSHVGDRGHSPPPSTAARSYWYVRDIGPCAECRSHKYDIANSTRRDVIVLTEPCDMGYAIRFADAMNRLDRLEAPRSGRD